MAKSRTSRRTQRSRRSSRKPVPSGSPHRIRSKNTVEQTRPKVSRATSSMSLTQLQQLAKSRGIPFGGLSKTKLIRKINTYY